MSEPSEFQRRFDEAVRAIPKPPHLDQMTDAGLGDISAYVVQFFAPMITLELTYRAWQGFITSACQAIKLLEAQKQQLSGEALAFDRPWRTQLPDQPSSSA